VLCRLRLRRSPDASACSAAFVSAGPLGQCFPIPDDQSIRAEMMRFVQNYAHIYSMYNFDYDPEPGSVQYKIDQRIKRVRSCMGLCRGQDVC